MSLDPAEAALVASLVAQVTVVLEGDDAARSDDPVEALAASMAAPVDPPDDPVLARLLPDAYRDDTEAAGEFRRLTEAELRAEKRAASQRVLDDIAAATGGDLRDLRIDLTPEAASQWLYSLTDVRLALGVRLDVTEDMDDERASLDESSDRYRELAVYDWVTWLQDALVRAMPTD